MSLDGANCAAHGVRVPAGSRHFFWNDGDEPAHYTQEFRPALRIEDFFEVLFRLAREGHLKENGMPKTLALAVLVPAMGREIRPTNVPWPFLRVLAWVLGPIARVRGYRSVEQPAAPRSGAGGASAGRYGHTVAALSTLTRHHPKSAG